MVDEVMEELWRVKDAIAREYGYDVRRLAESFKNPDRDMGRSTPPSAEESPSVRPAVGGEDTGG